MKKTAVYSALFIVLSFLYVILFTSFLVADYKTYIYSVILSAATVFIIYKFVYLRSIYNLVYGLYLDRHLIFSLAKNDFKTKYAGSYFGIIWAFIQPIMTILVFWFVFQVGLKSEPVKNVPFVLWLTSGLIPWFFFSDAWNNATNCFIEYGYLVKKVAFKVSMLPMIKVISSFFVHIIFVMFMAIIFVLFDFFPGWIFIQLAYYSFAMFVLVTALSFITSSIIIFFKDLSQIISIILQFGMWLTPIMWSIDIMPEEYIWIFKMNPMYYIVTGYRDTMINKAWFFLNIKQTFYFWLVTVILFLIGAVIFKKTRPHFADVL